MTEKRFPRCKDTESAHFTGSQLARRTDQCGGVDDVYASDGVPHRVGRKASCANQFVLERFAYTSEAQSKLALGPRRIVISPFTRVPKLVPAYSTRRPTASDPEIMGSVRELYYTFQTPGSEIPESWAVWGADTPPSQSSRSHLCTHHLCIRREQLFWPWEAQMYKFSLSSARG